MTGGLGSSATPAPGPSLSPPRALALRCWGARGSVPSPGADTIEYGGNTPCLEIRTEGRRLVFDGGTGIRQLGQRMAGEEEPADADIFLTHFHWDHIQGLPFFAPFYDPQARLRIHGPEQQDIDVRTLFASQMGPIYFPLPVEALAARVEFAGIAPAAVIELESRDGGATGPAGGQKRTIRIRTMEMRHAGTTLGFRVEAPAGVVCYIPDNEIVGGAHPVGPDWHDRLTAFVEGADLLIHDAMYNAVEYEHRQGWGHSTFAQSVSLAERAGVAKLLFFHHDPERSDAELRDKVVHVREQLSRRSVDLQVDAASEGSDILIEERAR